jgi:hypothetical protein
MLFAFQSLSDAHTNEMMTKIIVDILKKYKSENRLLVITTDNANNNEKMRKNIKNMLKKINVE